MLKTGCHNLTHTARRWWRPAEDTAILPAILRALCAVCTCAVWGICRKIDLLQVDPVIDD